MMMLVDKRKNNIENVAEYFSHCESKNIEENDNKELSIRLKKIYLKDKSLSHILKLSLPSCPSRYFLISFVATPIVNRNILVSLL
jgi:hypothetical protein